VRALFAYFVAWLIGSHVGECAGCERLARVRPSLDRSALLCRLCDRRSFGSVPFSKGRVG
jgi:hypothetical protein